MDNNDRDKSKKISNPLTIIGLFAGIAEVAGTVVLPTLSVPIQKIFIGYVMGFPLLLVGLFFYTLIRHPKKLYAPADYKDENNFLKALDVIQTVEQSNPEMKEALIPAKTALLKSYLGGALTDSSGHVITDSSGNPIFGSPIETNSSKSEDN